ncbi:calnexin isoform X3 [Puntigrus tetrazona]|uniref:calnexin isoform X3 n=1 Tax=Puntigrus tetrazona TaxID=1606681 RepID=UPI001C88F75F|nr:calnexin isoform X3 [Puntigrus tetrazona]
MMRGPLLVLCVAHFSGTQETHGRVAAPERVHFSEAFDGALDRNWVLSKAEKDEQLRRVGYRGVQRSPLPGKQRPGPQVSWKTPRHIGVPAEDLSLHRQTSVFTSQFSDSTPYTVMFGPDKCGSSHKIHFILGRRDPVTGTYEEKHAPQPETDLSEYFTDQRPHLYTLNLYPDDTFEILVDLTLINKGSVSEDMTSSAQETQDQDSAQSEQHGRFILSPVSAVGFELWSLTADVMFDNIFLSDSLEDARRWTEDTWGRRPSPGVIEKLLMATLKKPWLWGVYVVTVGLPIILFVSFMWPDKRFGPPDQDYYYKKTDEVQADAHQEEDVSRDEGVCPAAVDTEHRAVRRNTHLTA